MIITYAIMALIATILLIGYCALVRKKEPWLLLLYVCVTIVNTGYFLLSISKTVEFAVFANCSSLTDVIVPDSVTTIGECAFGGCGKLESLTIGSGVRSVGSNVRNNSNNLRSVYIKDLTAWCNISYAFPRLSHKAPCLELHNKKYYDHFQALHYKICYYAFQY